MPDRRQVSAFYIFYDEFCLGQFANVYIFMTLYDFCLHNFVTESYTRMYPKVFGLSR